MAWYWWTLIGIGAVVVAGVVGVILIVLTHPPGRD